MDNEAIIQALRAAVIAIWGERDLHIGTVTASEIAGVARIGHARPIAMGLGSLYKAGRVRRVEIPTESGRKTVQWGLILDETGE